MATLVADFTDAVVQMKSNYVYSNFYLIVGYVVISAIIFPLAGYFCNTMMIKYALLHDRKVIAGFLDKKYNKAMEMDGGEAQYRLENDPNDYRLIWMELMTNLTSIPIISAYILYSSLKLSWIYTLITIALSIVKLIIPMAIVKINAKYDEISREYSTEVRAYETDIIKKPYYAVILGIQAGLPERLDKKFWHYYYDIFKKQNLFQAITFSFSNCVDTISYLAVVLVGAYFVSSKILSAGSIASMIGYFGIYNYLFASVANTIQKVTILKNIKTRLRILYQDSETYGGYRVDSIETIDGKNVLYQYQGKTAVSALDFSISSAEHVAICGGSNGSGKSTFLKVLCRLNEDYQGSITVNGRELSSLDITEWRKKLHLPYKIRISFRAQCWTT